GVRFGASGRVYSNRRWVGHVEVRPRALRCAAHAGTETISRSSRSRLGATPLSSVRDRTRDLADPRPREARPTRDLRVVADDVVWTRRSKLWPEDAEDAEDELS